METIPELEWLSACCGRPPVGELPEPEAVEPVGECSRCHDYVTFNLEDTSS